ncbi:MAG: NHL repeat-containing protein [Planctomycetota bacterium]
MFITFLIILCVRYPVTTFASDTPLMTTVAGNGDKAVVGQPFGVEFGPDGGLYICDVQNHRVHRWDPKTDERTLVAGNGTRGYDGDGGPATAASLNEPYEVRFDAAGDMYFVEMKNAIVRKVDRRTGVITTVAGTGAVGFSGDGGPAVNATFNKPHSIVIRGDNLYVADIGNHRIRRVDLTNGIVETIAGTGERKPPVDGSVAKGKPVVGPRALFIDGDRMWVALREGHSVWILSLTDGRWTHVAGTGEKGFSGDGGSAKTATFNGPKGITATADGIAYVVDTENQVIRRIDSKRDRVSTVAGVGPEARGWNGEGKAAVKSWMDRPHGIGLGMKGDNAIYIGDTNNHRVRRVTLD